MLVNTEKMISVAKLQRELTQRLKDVSETGDPVFVLRNNSLAAVIVAKEEYETLKQIEEMLEYLDIAEDVQKRLKNHKRSKNIPWNKVKKDYAL
ncbi:MAG: hypothetical protein MAG551_00232 [Candidatus Scalindua arabica]|uniref:Antitoxin n=1 Tax=Candidatus Scalindua arabica TaxID=1127984 RepID=A0A941W139_9BACT|nr:hypothetical protein [Candidatus Scalindua arabica]